MPKDDLRHKNLDDANLSGTDLTDTDLSHASLRRARLQGAKLENATLANSDLHGARLDHADLTGADLRNADLTGASLHGVDLDRAATTEGVRLSGAKGLGGAIERSEDVQAAATHVAQAVEEMVLLTQDIAMVASAAVPAEPEQHSPSDAERRDAMVRINELREQRNLVEERILALIDESVNDQRGLAAEDPR